MYKYKKINTIHRYKRSKPPKDKKGAFLFKSKKRTCAFLLLLFLTFLFYRWYRYESIPFSITSLKNGLIKYENTYATFKFHKSLTNIVDDDHPFFKSTLNTEYGGVLESHNFKVYYQRNVISYPKTCLEEFSYDLSFLLDRIQFNKNAKAKLLNIRKHPTKSKTYQIQTVLLEDTTTHEVKIYYGKNSGNYSYLYNFQIDTIDQCYRRIYYTKDDKKDYHFGCFLHSLKEDANFFNLSIRLKDNLDSSIIPSKKHFFEILKSVRINPKLITGKPLKDFWGNKVFALKDFIDKNDIEFPVN